jgi:hypothetical protein
MAVLRSAVLALCFVGTVQTAALAQENATPVAAETTVAQNPAASGAVESPPLAIPEGTFIAIRLVAPVSSRDAVQGQFFPIALAEPILFEGREIVPAGIRGEGQVVHVQRRGFGGRAGELIVAARYLDWNGDRLPLRGMRIAAAGAQNTGEAVAAGVVVPLAGLFITGTSVDLPEGQLAVARLAAAIIVPPPPTVAQETTEPAAPAAQHEGKAQ